MKIVILGNGVAGSTAARHLRRADPRVHITMVSGESDLHFSRPALMYLYLGHQQYRDIVPYDRQFWERNRIDLRRGWVTCIDLDRKNLVFDDGDTLRWDKLLVATGSRTTMRGWPGQDLRRVQGFVSLQDLVALERATPAIDTAVIVGGGLIGVELAEMLRSRGRRVVLLVRERTVWGNVLPPEEGERVGRVVRAHGVDLRLEAELDAILDDGNGCAGAVRLRSGEVIRCQFVGIATGVEPQLDAVRGSGLVTGRRGVRVDERLRTSHPDVYAAGDCAEIHPPQGPPYLQQMWYTARAQGEIAAANLLGAQRRYDPGIGFNSAAFFDLLYQVYGRIPLEPSPDRVHHLWLHPDGRRSLRICTSDGRVIGIQTLGIRLRHPVCERWIRRGASLAEVLEHLDEADFEPEFGPRYTDIVRRMIRPVPQGAVDGPR